MVVVSLLRGVNVGSHHRIRMDPLKSVYESAGLTDVRTLLQSGNVLFRTKRRDLERLAGQLEEAFEKEFGFHSATLLRTVPELRAVASANPFAGRPGLAPANLAVLFLGAPADDAARGRLDALRGCPEEVHCGTRELYIYYPVGMARPVLTAAMLDRALLKIPATARNWNTVLKLVDLGAEMEEGAA
jgi:uncharacterized protein (DUF1697 family)